MTWKFKIRIFITPDDIHTMYPIMIWRFKRIRSDSQQTFGDISVIREHQIPTTRLVVRPPSLIHFTRPAASIPPAICLISVTYVGCNTDLAVALLTLGTMFIGGMYSGFLSNHIDIAPPFAGTLMGISNTFATIPGIVVPSFVGYMTHGNVSFFYICYVIYLRSIGELMWKYIQRIRIRSIYCSLSTFQLIKENEGLLEKTDIAGVTQLF